MTSAHIPLSKAIDGFLLARSADGYAVATIEQYQWALERLLTKVGPKPLGEVNVSDLRRFLVYLQTDYVPTRPGGNTEPLSDVSIFHAWKAIRAFYKWATLELEIENIAMKLTQPKHSYREIVPFTEGDIQKLLLACERTTAALTSNRASFAMRRSTADRDKALVMTMVDTGIRVGELCRADIVDYDQANGELLIRPVGSGAKSKSRLLPVGKTTGKALWKYLAQRETGLRDPLFVTMQGLRMKRTEVGHFCRRLGERAGVPNCHPHRFRHTFAIFYLRNKGDVFTLKRLLGHSTWKMVNTYLSIAEADVKEAHRRASPIDNIGGLG